MPETQTPKKLQEETSLKIEISRYKSIIETLDDPRKMRRIVTSILLVGILFFVGITIITITVKRIYPYSDIRTNMFGATTLRDESTEVTYWLFSTTELWANSGIKVKKNDILTIRSSGKTNTAIHHLYDYAKSNRKMQHEWLDSDGNIRIGRGHKLSGSDQLRSKYRIFPYQPQNSLIMQVVKDGKNYEDTVSPENSENFYYIGTEHNDLHINNDGTLFFAVNDIVLTDDVIYRMQVENLKVLCDSLRENTATKKMAESLYDEVVTASGLGDDDVAGKKRLCEMRERVKLWVNKDNGNAEFYEKYIKDSKGALSLGRYYKKEGEPEIWQNELDYYSEHGYKQAWFDDNIGSLLIVIERKN